MPFNKRCGGLGQTVGASRNQTVDTAGDGAGAAGTGDEESCLVAFDDGLSDRRLAQPGHAFLERTDQLKALGHTLRLRVLEVLSDSGPLTNRELAEALGVDPGHLHFHVRMLLRAGLIELAEGGKGREKPYRAVAERIYLSPELRTSALLGNAQAVLIETVARGWTGFGGHGRFRSIKATAHVSAETLQQLLRDFLEQVRLAEGEALAAGKQEEELLVSVFYHPPPRHAAEEQGPPGDGLPEPTQASAKTSIAPE